MRDKYNFNVLKTFFAAIFIILISSNNCLTAQSKDSVKLILKPTIGLKDGATLFSADSAFNSQISTNKIIRDKADIAYQNNKSGAGNLKMTTPKQGSGTITESKDKNIKEKRKDKSKNSTKRERKVSYFSSEKRIPFYC